MSYFLYDCCFCYNCACFLCFQGGNVSRDVVEAVVDDVMKSGPNTSKIGKKKRHSAPVLRRTRHLLTEIGVAGRPDILTWTPDNNVIINGASVRGSHIFDLAAHVVTLRRQRPLGGAVSPALPKGIRSFIQALIRLGIDQNLIRNKRRLGAVLQAPKKWLSMPNVR